MAAFPSWAGAKRVCLDVECRDDKLTKLGPGTRRGGYMVGIGMAIEDGPSHYYPIAHQGGDNLDQEAVLRYFQDQLSTFDGCIVGANLSYDLDYMMHAGLKFPRVKRYLDVCVAEPLLDELQDRYSLEAIAQRRGLPGKDETLLRQAAAAYNVDPKGGLWRLPARYVGPYGEQDVRLPLELLRRQEKVLEQEDLFAIWDLECELLPALVRMRARGVPVSVQRVMELDQWARTVQAEEINKIHHLTPHRVGVECWFRAEELEPLFRQAGITVPRTNPTKQGKTRPSITKGLLSQHAKHPLVASIKRGREFAKLRQFCASILQHEVKGRIHCTFNQLRKSTGSEDEDGDEDSQGGRFGRMSAVDPNLQQQPIRHKEYGARWRSIFVADPGTEWAMLDYSQQEPRMAVHYAEALDLPGAFAFGERYRNDPKTDFHDMTASVTQLDRKDAKVVGLGIMYGMGGGKLCTDLGLPTQMETNASGRSYVAAGPAGKEIMSRFDNQVPFLRALSKRCSERVRRVGYIRTLLGRRCRFPRDSSGNYDWLHKALNRLIQGGSADQTKKAIVELDRAGFPLILQVHDEADMLVTSRRQAIDAAILMRDAVKLKVPNRVDLEVGEDWGNLEQVELAAA